MSTTTGDDPLLLRAQDVAVVCPKADNNKMLPQPLKTKKMAMSGSEERANASLLLTSCMNLGQVFFTQSWSDLELWIVG